MTKAEAGRGDDPQLSLRPADETPHYHGHRERLRDRFRKGGAEALADYELLELILFRAMPRRDVKPLAKALIARFGPFAEVVSARPERLAEIEGLGEAAIVEIRIVEAAARRLAKSSIEKRPSMSSFSAVVDYCRTAMAFLDHEEFRILFLDKRLKNNFEREINLFRADFFVGVSVGLSDAGA